MPGDRRTSRLVLLSAVIAATIALVFVLRWFYPELDPLRTVGNSLIVVGVVVMVVALVRRRSR
jgi:hypothetical protein